MSDLIDLKNLKMYHSCLSADGIEKAGLSSFFTNMSDIVLNSLTSIKHGIDEINVSGMTRHISSIRLFENKKGVTLNNIDFPTYGMVLVPIPTDFHGNLLEYTNYLIAMSSSVEKDLKKDIADLHLRLSAVANDTNRKVDISAFKALYANNIKATENHAKEMSKYFRNRNGRSVARLMDVFNNTTELSNALTRSLALEGVYNNKSTSSILKAVDSLKDPLTALKEGIEKKELDITPRTMKIMADGLMAFGKYIGVYTDLAYNTDVLLKTLSDIKNKVEADIK